MTAGSSKATERGSGPAAQPKPGTDPAAQPGFGTASAPLLEFDAVTFGYEPARPILRDLSWRIARGEFWAVLGPSGSGKTTLLYLAAGIRTPAGGRVLLNGASVHGPTRRVGLMLQDYGLLPWYTAQRNLEVGLAIQGHGVREQRERGAAWLGHLGLSAHARKYPAQLSGGQRQRVALARQFALEPELLLLDEPLSAVDELTRERLQRQLHGLVREQGKTTVLVTHNIEEAVLLADHILLVTKQDPVEDAEVLTTPFGGAMPARDDPAFLAYCRLLRERLVP